jgi:endonuclease/exonuclease/phosphatase (EEP) superfamily protein YafD
MVFTLTGDTSSPWSLATQAALPASVCAAVVAAGVSARRFPRLCRAAFALVLCWVALALDARLAATPPPASGTTVSVMSANMLLSNNDDSGVYSALMGHRPDVLVTVETTAAVRAALTASEYVLVASGSGRASAVHVWSTIPVVAVSSIEFTNRTLPAVEFSVGGSRFTVVGVHLMSPTTEGTRKMWEQEWQELPVALAQVRGPVVVLGDFNTSHLHAPMRALLEEFDSASYSSFSISSPTWPTREFGWWRTSGVQLLDLDHILVREMGASKFMRVHVPGSDHAAVAATISVVNK